MARQVREERTRLQRLDKSVERLDRQLSQLWSTVGQVVTLSAVENVLQHGFDVISAELAPLRGITPRRILLTEGAKASLTNLYGALKRPEWKGAGLLGVAELHVPFIGEAREVLRLERGPEGPTSTFEGGIAQ